LEFLSVNGQQHVEGGADLTRIHPDVPPVCFHDPPRDEQAETASRAGARPRPTPHERVEDDLSFRERDARALVPDADAHGGFLIHDLNAHHAVWIRVEDRVPNQVHHRGPKVRRIRQRDDRRLCDDLEGAPRQMSLRRDGVLHQLRDVDVAGTQLPSAHSPPEDALRVRGELLELAEREHQQLVIP
jgi:hypothetical protein